MSDVVKKRAAALVEKLEADGTLSEGPDEEYGDPECWKEELIENAFAEACNMVTQASPDDGPGMHPMDAVSDDNVKRVYATGEPWKIPTFVVELETLPEYIDNALTENRTVWSRRKPGLSSERTWVRIQVR